MPTLPAPIIRLLRHFESVFSERVWPWAMILVVGAILAPGTRTVTAILRVMGLSHDRHFQNFHRVLNRARWSPVALGRILLRLLVSTFLPADAPIIVGLDDHLERRTAPTVPTIGVYRDAVRSHPRHLVTSRGVRWLSMQLLVPISWAQRTWALPFLTVLAPSKRYHQQRQRRHKTLSQWARQMICQLRRWLPTRHLVVVADSTYAAIAVIAACQGLSPAVTLITRLRLDAALYDLAPPPRPGKRGRPASKGARQPTLAARLRDPATVWETTEVAWYGGTRRTVHLATGVSIWYHRGMPPVTIRWVLVRDPAGKYASQALLSSTITVAPAQIVEWFVLRWQLEVTFEEARAHLGIETQRQWSARAIARTTPALLGLYSVVTLFAHALLDGQEHPVRQAAWYVKERPTFSDTLALVRQHLWPVAISWISPKQPDMIQIPRALFERFTDALAYAA